MLRLAFHLALRQTEGLMASIFVLLDVPLSTPDHSTLSRRARTRGRRFKSSLPDHFILPRINTLRSFQDC
jgi:hypothetical protein